MRGNPTQRFEVQTVTDAHTRRTLRPVASAMRARRAELERLEVLAEQLHARIDVLRAELCDDPWEADALTPVVASRWRK